MTPRDLAADAAAALLVAVRTLTEAERALVVGRADPWFALTRVRMDRGARAEAWPEEAAANTAWGMLRGLCSIRRTDPFELVRLALGRVAGAEDLAAGLEVPF